MNMPNGEGYNLVGKKKTKKKETNATRNVFLIFCSCFCSHFDSNKKSLL